MTVNNDTLRICVKGHRYHKSSDCPACPDCESERKPVAEFMTRLAASARRALEKEGIKTIKKLSKYIRKELMNLHSFGKSSLPVLPRALKKTELSFKPG